MSLLSYISSHEDERIYPLYPREEFYINYPYASPRVIRIETTEVVGHSPYANTTTQTWWQFNDTTNAYEDTGVSLSVSAEDLNDVLADVNISTFINDANYATSDEDEPLTLDEVREILQ